MGDTIIELKGVSKSFGKNRVLNSIDLEIPKGKITGIIGASGEGKSTILKMMVSFYKPSSGKVLYSGENVMSNLQDIKKNFGLSIEEGSFYENLTVKENLIHFGKLYHVERKVLKRRVKGLAYFVGLENAFNVLAGNLSLGMKKRLDLACSLVHKPSVLILDEPTADLDPLLRKQFLHLIKKINSHGTTIVLTTQLMSEVEEICDKVAILCNEKIVEEGSLSKIKKKYNTNDMNKVFEKIFSNKRKKTYQESSEKKTEVHEEKKDSKSPWEIVDEKIELNKRLGNYKDDF
jgi:ABC-2 type transport system ATP-binding protein